MRIALLGASGQVGWELQRALVPFGEVIAVDRSVDIAEFASVEASLVRLKPTVIVNAAAHTRVDEAECDPRPSLRTNAQGPAVLAEVAKRLCATLVHYSTDYVFDGRASVPYAEQARPNPLNAYGRSKLAGEEAIRISGCHHLILRTSWVFSARRSNFLRSILAAARTREELSVVDDQWGTPTGAELIADVSAHLLGALVAGRGDGGTYHLTAGGAVSRWELARFLVHEAIRRGARLRLSVDGILSCKTSASAACAPRPLNGLLDHRALEETFGVQLPAWQAGVLRVLDTWAEFDAWPRGESV